MANNGQGERPAPISAVTGFVLFTDWLARSARRLATARGETGLSAAVTDTRLLAAKFLDLPKTHLMAYPEMLLTTGQAELLDAGLQRLVDGEPLPYVLGEWEFYGRQFSVTPQTLIPRPETELIIEQVISWANERQIRHIADAGTGSGCIAISLALELPDAHITATDISHTALQVARSNMLRYSLQDRVNLVQADLLNTFRPGSFQIICANLPYIPSERLEHLAVSRHEPKLALDGGPDGLDVIGRLVSDAGRLLVHGGLALLELDDSHMEAVLALARETFPGSAQVMRDYQKKPRLLRLEKQSGQV